MPGAGARQHILSRIVERRVFVGRLQRSCWPGCPAPTCFRRRAVSREVFDNRRGDDSITFRGHVDRIRINVLRLIGEYAGQIRETVVREAVNERLYRPDEPLGETRPLLIRPLQLCFSIGERFFVITQAGLPVETSLEAVTFREGPLPEKMKVPRELTGPAAVSLRC